MYALRVAHGFPVRTFPMERESCATAETRARVIHPGKYIFHNYQTSVLETTKKNISPLNAMLIPPGAA